MKKNTNRKIIAAVTWMAIILGFLSILIAVLIYGVMNRVSQEENAHSDPLDEISRALAINYQATSRYPDTLATLYESDASSNIDIDYIKREIGYCVTATYTQGGTGSSEYGSPSYYTTENRDRSLGVCPPEGVSWSKVSYGATFAVAVGSDGEMYVWGEGANGELGLGRDDTQQKRPVKLDRDELFDGGLVTQVSTGESHVIAVVNNKDIYTWGRGDERLGQGKHRGTSVFTPSKVEPPEEMDQKSIFQVSASRLNSYVLTTDGSIFSWGSDSNGQLGTSEPMPQFETGSAVPVEVEMIELLDGNKITRLIASPYGTQVYALDSDGVLYGWGSNPRNSLTMTTDDEVVDVPIEIFEETEFDDLRFESIDISATHAVAYTRDGLLFAWGNSAFGQYGNGSTQRQSEPMLVDMSRMRGVEINSVIVGPHIDDRYSIAYTDSGMFVWGGNSYGLFDNDDARIRRPIFVPSVYAS